MTSTALARPSSLQLGSLSEPAELGRLLAASGYFEDAREAAQAVVKVLAGHELGVPPIKSMTDVFIVKGKVTLSAALMGAVIKAHPRYNYRVVELADDRVEIRFFEDGEDVGVSEFTMKDAERAGLTKPSRSGEPSSYAKFPRNMLFWRALSNGAKFYCPDVFIGSIYTPDELGVDVDPETGEIIEASAPAPRTPPVPGPAEASPAAEPSRDEPVSVPDPSAPAVSTDDLVALFEQHEVPEASRRMALLQYGKRDVGELTPEEATAIRQQVLARYATA